MTNLLGCALLIVMALLSGTMFAIAVGFNPSALSSTTYLEQQQAMIRSFNTLLPAMGAFCILLLGVLAFRSAGIAPIACALFCCAGLLMIAAAIITRFANQPINAIVATWTSNSMPLDWMVVRDRWWSWHLVRSAAALSAYVLTVVGFFIRGAIA
jgi:Domain of unknown function (DUF1772)